MNITRNNYRSHPALNYSAAKHLLRSPAHFRWTEEHPIEPTEEMRMGTEIHKVLTGEPIVAIQKPEHNPDDPSDMWHGNKKWCRAWMAENDPDTIYGLDAFAGIHGATDAIKRSALAQSILMLCDLREHPIVADYRGIQIKGLLDAAGTDVDGKRFIADLKTTADASPDAFARKARGLDYDLQAAYYTTLLAMSEGLEYQPSFVWLVVETEAPYGISAYQADAACMESGQRKMDECIARYQECQQSGKWVGYPEEIQQLTMRW